MARRSKKAIIPTWGKVAIGAHTVLAGVQGMQAAAAAQKLGVVDESSAVTATTGVLAAGSVFAHWVFWIWLIKTIAGIKKPVWFTR